MNISISLWDCQIVYFGGFLFVQNFQIFFGFPTSFRNWILTHPGSTKNQFPYLNKTHVYLLHQKYQLPSFFKMILGERPVCLLGFNRRIDVQVDLRHLAGGKWDILLFILFFGSEFGSLNPKNWPKSVVFLVLGVPWLGSLCQNETPKTDSWIRQCV